MTVEYRNSLRPDVWYPSASFADMEVLENGVVWFEHRTTASWIEYRVKSEPRYERYDSDAGAWIAEEPPRWVRDALADTPDARIDIRCGHVETHWRVKP